MRYAIALITLSCIAPLFPVRSTAADASNSGQDNYAPINLSDYNLSLVYSNDFSRPEKIAREENFIEQTASGAWQRTGRPHPAAQWIAEGWGGAMIRDGKLWVAPSPFDDSGHPTVVPTNRRSHMVVWNRRIFPADFLLQFEMSPCSSTNGLTIVFFNASGADGRDLFDLSLPPRRGVYRNYHSGAIANYTDSYWSRNNKTESVSNRLRKNPGFRQVASGPSFTTGPTDVTHRVRILKCRGHIQVEIDGKTVIRWDDSDPLGPGRIGLRSMEGVTMVAYDNFKVWQVTPKTRAGESTNSKRPGGSRQ